MTTRDGVEIDPLGEYWRISVFEEYDFSGIHKGKLPQHQARNNAYRVVGGDVTNGQMYASTKHLANYYGFVDLMERIKEEEKVLEREIKKLQRRREKVNQRLNQWLEQQKG